MNSAAVLPGMPAGRPAQDNEVFDGVIAVRPKSLVVGNAVYQLSNISVITIADLTTIKKVPVYLWILAGLDILLFLIPANQSRAIAILLLCITVYLFYNYFKNMVDAKFALLVTMNSGTNLSLMSSDLPGLKYIVLELSRAIENKGLQPFNAIINNGSISFTDASGSVVNHGIIAGDVVNQV